MSPPSNDSVPETVVRKFQRECQRLYKEERGKELSDDEALDMALHLLSLYRRLYYTAPPQPDHHAPPSAAEGG